MSRDLVVQVAQVLGALLVLIPFGAAQMHRMTVDTRMYQALNLAGSAILTVIAIVERQYGFVLLEGVWAAMSFQGLLRVVRRKGP